ncbi:hypothetical protein J0H58_16560 [bacterium]|nr:hypothetical protein [bacterium]
MGKEELLKRLRAAGAERVEAQYDGYSDEGLLFEVELYGPDGATVPGPDDGLWRDIEEVVCDLLSRQWPGWEINDGSIGTAVIAVGTGLVEGEHGTRYTEIDFDSYEGAL